mmetsp:Transcript_9125/g.41430  ORF Transcript_9125/g.41430 Transcript_9125/m.41430 type:complete len:96 (-) Transcript_9125:2776-3063(-)
MPYRPYERRSTYERSWLYRHKAVRDYPSSTITEPRHPTPPPLKPTMAEADDDKKWYSKPNKRESLWGLGGMAIASSVAGIVYLIKKEKDEKVDKK